MFPSSASVDPSQSSHALVRNDPTGTSILSPADPQGHQFLSHEEGESHQEEVCAENIQKQEVSTPDPTDSRPFQECVASIKNPHRGSRIMRQYWIWEIGACFFSLTCAFTVSVLLWHENGKELKHWNWYLAPNVVVSYIGTLIKVSFVMVLSEILSQLKWIHFKVTNPLWHLRIFESASRGPIGSAMLIWSSKRWLASFAAVLMICSLLVDPFFQLALKYPTVLKIDQHQRSFYLSSNTFDPDMKSNTFITRYHGEAQYAMYPKASKEMMKAIDEGLSPSNRFMNTTCPTGHCNWPNPITMLGVCGKCDSVTASIKSNCSATLPSWRGKQFYEPSSFMMVKQSYDSAFPTMVRHGFHRDVDIKCDYSFPTLASYNQTLSLSARGKMAKNGDLKDMKNLLWSSSMDQSVQNRSEDRAYIIRFFALQSKEMDRDAMAFPDVRAWTCELTWCAKTLHNITVHKGNQLFTPAIESTLYYRNSSLDSGKLELYPKYDRLGVDGQFFVDHHAAKSLTDQLSMAFNVSYGSRTALGMGRLGNDELVGDTLITSQVAMSQDLNRTIRKLASSLTDMVRSSRYHNETDGHTMKKKTVIQVEWAWFALPIVLPILTGILLAIVAVRSHVKDVAAWKDDPFALLFHRLDGADLAPLYNGTADPHEIDSMLKEISVKLSSDKPLTLVRANVIANKAQPWWRTWWRKEGRLTRSRTASFVGV